MANFWEGRVENRTKTRKDPISLVLGGQFLQFVNKTLEHPLYTFLMTNLLLLSQKLATKLKKKCIFRSISHGSLHFSPFPPKIFVSIDYANQKFFRKNLWGGGGVGSTPLITKGVILLLKFYYLNHFFVRLLILLSC